MAYIGKTPSSAALTSSDISDGIISTVKIANDATTLAKMASGTDGNIISYDASGNPVAVATGSDGQVLTSTGAGSPPAFEAIPDGGLPGMDMWRQTADTTSNAQPISSNWERVDTNNFAGIGTAFSAPSSGIWTFPSTGIWEVEFEVHLTNSGGDAVANSAIQVTTNNSSYSIACYSQAGVSGGDFKANFTARIIVDVTDTAQVKFKLDIDNLNGSTMSGDTNNNQTYVIMKKLGET